MLQQSLIAVSPVSQDLLFTPDASFDIGKNGATRPRNGYYSGILVVGSGAAFVVDARSKIKSPADNVFTLFNNAETDFGRLQFGGTTNAFPSLRRIATTLQARLADDSAYCAFVAQTFSMRGLTQITSSTDGNATIFNNAGTDFNLLQFGGLTSAFPALKRSAATIAVRLADDSADAGISSGNVVSSGYVKTQSTTVAALAAAATAGAGARSFVTDATATTFLSVVAGGGANKVPVVSDGTNWLIG